LLAELAALLILHLPDATMIIASLGPKAVGMTLFGSYGLLVQAAAVLLLAALAAVLYLSRNRQAQQR